jgi:predicted nucleic acid-binding protein
MNAYADTAFICSIHAPDAHTGRAIAWLSKHRDPLPFTGLHRLEFRNALRLRVFRKEITTAQRELSIQAMLSDLADGVFAHVDPTWAEVLSEAERLSAGHSEIIGTRSLDILHVAGALVLGAKQFVTFDNRQATLARAVGLRIPAL